jgi:anti-sigma regulatory factor (Ser/Thr protein kinase)
MSHSPAEQLITLTVDAAALARLDQALGGYCAREALPDLLGKRLRLLLEELATNTLHYGQCAGSTIEIRLQRAGDALSVDYRDRGIAFDPTREAPDDDVEAPLEQRRVGGLGWPLIHAFCDRIDYRRERDANCLRLRLTATG